MFLEKSTSYLLIGFKMDKGKIAVELRNVSKKYTLYFEKPTLAENILNWKKKEEFFALKQINLNIKKGESVGFIGPNGSGKTTLLEIIAGITYPTTGIVKTYGKVVSLIDLEAGFHPELTGEENILLNGLLTGMSKEEIKKKMSKIKKFAGIGKFINAPFYTYSSGMRLRLGYSIVVYSDPEILVMDENLAVGDEDFRKRSKEKLHEFIKNGVTIMMASHNLDYLGEICQRLVKLRHGKIIGEEK